MALKSDALKAISEAGMSYEITMFFRQFWVDPRLKWGMVSVDLDDSNRNGSAAENGTSVDNETAASNGTIDVQLYKRADKSYNVAADMVDLLWLPDTFFIDEIGNFHRFVGLWTIRYGLSLNHSRIKL